METAWIRTKPGLASALCRLRSHQTDLTLDFGHKCDVKVYNFRQNITKHTAEAYISQQEKLVSSPKSVRLRSHLSLVQSGPVMPFIYTILLHIESIQIFSPYSWEIRIHFLPIYPIHYLKSLRFAYESRDFWSNLYF